MDACGSIGGAWGEEDADYGILDGGAVSSCASLEIIQMIADEWEPLGRTSSVKSNGGKLFLRRWRTNEKQDDNNGS